MPKAIHKGWFDVDKDGLAKLLQQRGKAFAIFELMQNAWDQQITRVDVEFKEVPNQPAATLVVIDDDPNGFQDIRHAFTLFAESSKKDDPEKRGRFNLGEKLVLSLCNRARITTTTGSIEFQSDGTRRRLRQKRTAGSEFWGELRMTREEYREALAELKKLIPPDGIATYINGDLLAARRPVAVFEASLPTVVADQEGVLKRSRRKTIVRVFEPFKSEVPSVYELGIPVVLTGDRWHVDVGQKVPLNMDRDNLPPAYLKELRTVVLNQMHEYLTAEETTSIWTQDAMASPDVADEAVTTLIKKRFGERCVSYDPSDLEANSRAVAEGYTLVHGRMLNADQWKNVKRATAIRPSGQVFPTPKPYGDGPPEQVIDPEVWTAPMRATAEYARILANHLLHVRIGVKISVEPTARWDANYGHRVLCLNLGTLGHQWFEGVATEPMNELLLHEFAHEHAGNHLSEEYHEALCRLGARLASLALSSPILFDTARYQDQFAVEVKPGTQER